MLLINLRAGAADTTDARSTWLMALKRTRFPLTSLALAAFMQEETRRFVQALSWAEQALEAGSSGSADRASRNEEAPTMRETLMSFANWLYLQTRGQALYLVETLKELYARQIILPSLRENASWGLAPQADLLAQLPVGELVPPELRELIRSQLSKITTSAWELLVAGATLAQELTFERLLQVAQLNERDGLLALEELLRHGLLSEGTLLEGSQALDGYAFLRELVRSVVCQEAGAARQWLVQRRVSEIAQKGQGKIGGIRR